jgi:hypothetical protein
VRHNLIAACRRHGLNAQEAFDHLGRLLAERLKRFDELVESLPHWSDVMTGPIADYVEGVRNSVRANLYWSLRTERYFGAATVDVWKTRKVDVMVRPSYLECCS